LGVYVVAGCASGVGRAIALRLRARGDEVIGIDIHDADIKADLSDEAGRAAAISAVLHRASLDGAIIAHGLTATRGRPPGEQVLGLRFRAVVDLLDGWRPLLANTPGAKVVVSTRPEARAIPESLVGALLAGRYAAVVDAVRSFGSRGPRILDAACSIAVLRWFGRAASAVEWGGAGIAVNATVAPVVAAARVGEPAAGAAIAERLNLFTDPAEASEPGLEADWMATILSPAADAVRGAVIASSADLAAAIRLATAPADWDGDDSEYAGWLGDEAETIENSWGPAVQLGAGVRVHW
jgi:NAD(P)-dependent dehydrogenase (short-subunit alcohol dehydrogenase family)